MNKIAFYENCSSDDDEHKNVATYAGSPRQSIYFRVNWTYDKGPNMEILLTTNEIFASTFCLALASCSHRRLICLIRSTERRIILLFSSSKWQFLLLLLRLDAYWTNAQILSHWNFQLFPCYSLLRSIKMKTSLKDQDINMYPYQGNQFVIELTLECPWIEIPQSTHHT